MTGLIPAYMAATATMKSPDNFRLWSAISLVSCAASRRVWTEIETGLKLFPNTFIFLVGPPGVGKSRPMDLNRSLLPELQEACAFTGDEVTREEMIRHMGSIFLEKWPEGRTSFSVIASEIATFMPKPDPAWLQGLARLWDNPELYERRTKHQGIDKLYNPYLNMLVGLQPAWFAEGFASNNYELGFPARVFLPFADEKPHKAYFGPAVPKAALGALRNAVANVNAAAGHFVWTPVAQRKWTAWVEGGMQPVPVDALLGGYNVRRDMHGAKLALIAALSDAPGASVITGDHLDSAWGWMFAMERDMPRALAAAGGNSYRLREERIETFVRARYIHTQKPVREMDIRRFAGKMIPTQMLSTIMDELVAQGRVVAVGGSAPTRLFKAGGV